MGPEAKGKEEILFTHIRVTPEGVYRALDADVFLRMVSQQENAQLDGLDELSEEIAAEVNIPRGRPRLPK